MNLKPLLSSPSFVSEDWIESDMPASPPEGAIGFIYCIYNLLDGRKYIGKKLCRFTKTKYKTVTQKNGIKKKKKIKELVDSDWREYYGSNDELKKDVEKLGKENFHRQILEWCYSLGEMSYLETKYQFGYDVLLYPELYYNKWIMCRVSSTHVKRFIGQGDNE